MLLQISFPYIICLLATLYVLYIRVIHPLRRFPGPVLAPLTSLWKAYYVYNLTLHEKLVQLHERYGPVVRIGPNHLHFWDGEAIAPIYKDGKMKKSEFYDAFTAFNPNLFGMTDSKLHSLRRRQLSHGFSQSSIQNFEPIIDEQIQILINKLEVVSQSGEMIDLKSTISHFVLDVLGKVAFNEQFNAQQHNGEIEHLSAINDHLLLSCVIGELPLQPMSKLIARWSPIGWMRRLVKSRNKLKEICASCVKQRFAAPDGQEDLLQVLVKARDPETGAKLTEQDVNSDAFAMLVAGSHSTSGTLTLLFWNLLHNPDVLSQVMEELSMSRNLAKQNDIYCIAGLEASLPYLGACIKENFRLNPVFTMPLWRRVPFSGGLSIGGVEVPPETNVCISNYVLHHNPSIWGPEHNEFHPQRWLDDTYSGRFLIPFSIGSRMCIGRNLAMTNILKTTTTLLNRFNFYPARSEKDVRVRSSGIGEMEGMFQCRVSVKS